MQGRQGNESVPRRKCARRACLLLSCLLLATSHALAARIINVHYFSMKIGDHPTWSRPDLDEADWQQKVDLHDVPHVDSVIWLRAPVELGPDNLPENHPLAIHFAAIASHEIWWDGELIGQGGTVGTERQEETPGPIQANYAIPDRLATPGIHQIAIRTSAFHRHFRPSTGFWIVLVGVYDRLAAAGSSYTRIALISLSGIVFMAIFALMMFAQDPRDRSFLFLGLLCITAAGLLIAESWRNLFGYTYNWHLLRLSIVTGLAWLLDGLLLIFLARRFPLSGARWFVAAGIAGATIPLFTNHAWDPKAIQGFFWVFLLSALWSLRAVQKRLSGSIPAAFGLWFCFGILMLSPAAFLERNLYLALDFLLICLLGSHVLQVRQVRREREAALLKSARLEIELLKKHIQPHFLMNTLTALSEWVDQEPRLAARMIQTLSEEFRVLSDISNRSLIRMEDEIRLCRTHLDIMSQRKRREYSMSTSGVDLEASIPPAVIHTLVENAITHGRHTDKKIEFRLREESSDGRRRYVFSSPLSAPNGERSFREGTGLRYIKARLQESFGDNWTLSSRADGSWWTTGILVPARS